MRVQVSPRGWDRAIAALAERQHGVVGRAQLSELSVGRGAIGQRLARGRLHLVHRGVYAVGHRVLSREGKWMAAILAAGPGAVLSHRSASALWGIRPSARRVIEVTGPRRRRVPGVDAHRSCLPSDEVTEIAGIPVTTVPRTLLDLAAVLPRRQVERAMNEVEARELTDALSLPALLARYPRRRGACMVKAILADRDYGSSLTRSELEERFLAFLARYDLPLPEFNAQLRVGDSWMEVDCVWRAQRLVVELDGRAFHDSNAAYERDRARDRALSVARWRPVRVTWRHLHHAPARLAADLRNLTSAESPMVA